MPTKLKNEELQIVDYRYDEGIRGKVDSNVSSTLTTKSGGFSGMPMIMKQTLDTHTHTQGGNMEKKLRIRKLTPKECLKLQGFSEDDYNAIKDEFSDSAIYHVAGDSITVSTLVALFGELTDLPYRNIIEKYVETLKGDYGD